MEHRNFWPVSSRKGPSEPGQHRVQPVAGSCDARHKIRIAVAAVAQCNILNPCERAQQKARFNCKAANSGRQWTRWIKKARELSEAGFKIEIQQLVSLGFDRNISFRAQVLHSLGRKRNSGSLCKVCLVSRERTGNRQVLRHILWFSVSRNDAGSEKRTSRRFDPLGTSGAN